MKLYYSPAACSFAPHIALYEAGLPFEAVKVDLRKHTLADGTDYNTINPKGYVPVLELDDGTRLSEVAVVLQYIADQKPGTLAPVFGKFERYRLMEWLNFTINTLDTLPLRMPGVIQSRDLWRVLVFAAASKLSVHQGCHQLERAPSGPTVLGLVSGHISQSGL